MSDTALDIDKAPPPRWQLWLGFGTVYLVWGSTYLAIRIMVETMPPLMAGGARFTLAGGLLLLLLILRSGPSRVRVPRQQLVSAAIVGVLLAATGNGVVMVAEVHVPSAIAALIVAAAPLFIVLYRTIARDRVPAATLLGVAIGFAGVAVLMLPGARPSGVPLGSSLLLVLASASWGLGTFAAPRLRMPKEAVVSTGWQMLVGGLVLLCAAMVAGQLTEVQLSEFSTRSLLAFVFLVVFGSWIAFTAYSWLLQNAPVSQVATYAYVNPLVAVVLGWAILDEPVGVGVIGGTILIVASVWLIVRRETQGAPAAPPTSEPGVTVPDDSEPAAR